MNRKFVCYFILVLFVVGLISCGDSDDEETNQPTKPTTETQKPTDDEVIEDEKEIDFAAEEAAIRELFESHTAAVRENDINKIMEHWLKLETKEVFISHQFLGIATVSEKWKGVKDFWVATKAAFDGVPLPTTMLEVGIDARAENATLSGNYRWEVPGAGVDEGKYIAAFRKDNNGNWKIRAIDFGDRGLIKEINPPQP